MFAPEKWPLLVISIAMIVAAFIDGWKLKVPNWLTFPIIISGWLLALAFDFTPLTPPSPPSPLWCYHIFASLFVMMLGFVLLYPVRLMQMMGMGDVKMQMGFASWMGACYGLYGGSSVFLYGYVIGVLVGGVLGMVMMLTGGQIQKHLDNAREITTDVLTLPLSKVAEKAKQRKSSDRKLPYGIPLCIGYVAYLFYLNS